MFKKVPYPAIVLFSFAVFLSCSRFDDTTSLGKDILKDADPSIMSFDANFKTISGQTISESYSIPDTSGYSNFGVHSGSIVIGGYDEGTASGYFEFAISTAEIKKLIRLKSVKSISIEMDSILRDTSAKIPECAISLFEVTDASKYSHSQPTDPIATVNLNYTTFFDTTYNEHPDTINGTIDTVTDTIIKQRKEVAFNKISFNINGIDSIFDTLAHSYQHILDSCNNVDSADIIQSKDTTYFRFTLFSDVVAPIMRFRTPKMIINYKALIATDTLTSDTISASYINYALQEKKPTEIDLNSPYSSYASGRIAVFKLDLEQFWDTLAHNSNGLHQILSATVSISPKELKNFENGDSTYKVRYLLSETEQTDCFKLNALQAFAATGSVKRDAQNPGSLVSADTLCLNIAPFLQRLTLSQPSEVYLYLQLTEADLGWKQILWNTPKFQAILTTLR